MTSIKSILLSNHSSVVVLVLLSCLGVWLSDIADNTLLIHGLITLTVMIKGQQIVDVFMELYSAPPKWRWLMLSYIIVIPCIILFITII